MNAELEFYRRLFRDFLPIWSERGGYIEGFQGSEYIFPQNVTPIPIQFAPSASLDGLLIDPEHSPASPQLLANYIQSLSPGGIVILHLKSKFWNKKTIYETFSAAGFEILYLNKIPDIKHITYDSGYIKVKGFFSNLFFFTFPTSFFSINGNYFIIAKKNFYKNPTEPHLQFSIVLILSKDQEKSYKKLKLWEKFIQEHKIHNVEIILLENSMDRMEFNHQFPQVQIIQHYTNSFLEDAIYSGIFKSNGKIILIDADEKEGNPNIFFEVFYEFLKHPSSLPLAVYAYPKQQQSQFLKRFYYLFLYGTKNPDAKYRMYNQKCKEIFLKHHPYSLKQNPYLIEKEIKKNKGEIISIPYFEEYEPLKKKS